MKATIIDSALRLSMVGCAAIAVHGVATSYKAGDMFSAPMIAVYGLVGMLALGRVLRKEESAP